MGTYPQPAAAPSQMEKSKQISVSDETKDSQPSIADSVNKTRTT